MALPNIFNTGRSGMVAAKARMSTSSHNISNANTEGFSRQNVEQKADVALPHGSRNQIGTGTLLARVDRSNDNYLEKQLRNADRDLSHFEEKDLVLQQTEDIFNEMNGEGLNRITARFFNNFRQLSNEPGSEAVRQSVRESSQAMINDFKRMRSQVEEVKAHIDQRIEGYAKDMNEMAKSVRDLNLKIQTQELSGAPANDLRDQRDVLMRKLSGIVDLQVHTSEGGAYDVDIRGLGPLINGPNVENFLVARTANDGEGKTENSVSLLAASRPKSDVTHTLKGGKMGALLEVRDQTLNTVLKRLDDLAATISDSVNAIHSQGFNRYGTAGTLFFKPIPKGEGAAGKLALSTEVENDVNMIATAATPDSPGDNRIALAISKIQSAKILDQGSTTIDDFYNSIVSDVGVVVGRNRSSLNQQKDVSAQLQRIRDQISGVSIDEETANLLQYQHAFNASAKVIQVADECLKTVLDLKR